MIIIKKRGFALLQSNIMMVNYNANIFYTKRFNQEGWFDTISYEFVVIPFSEVSTTSDIQAKKKSVT